MTNKLLFYRDRELLRELVLGARCIEVGSSPGCDLAAQDPSVARRAHLIQARGGTVWVYDLMERKLEPRVLGYDAPLPVGARHCVVRVHVTGSGLGSLPDASQRSTLPLSGAEDTVSRWTVLVGRGESARRVEIAEHPVRIGAARCNELVLLDPTVSAQHCRFEPRGRSLFVRDLDSRNGTYVQGIRVAEAQVGPGAQLRVGRTDLVILASSHESQGGARLVAESGAMRAVVAEAEHFARLPWPLLILGPSGVGKEELAGLVHGTSGRRGPLVALNAGGLPRELIESELFGHEKGAFTGATAKRRGVFEQAQGGTLFLDEIGELPLDLQARLLRILETWQVRPVGAEYSLPLDVRLVCATHRDLARMVQDGTFREDLYWRLARLVVRLTPLADRADDVLPLARHFLEVQQSEVGARALSPAAEARLLAHPWPGNARELRNVIGVAAAVTGAQVLDAGDIEQAIKRLSGSLSVRPGLEPSAIESVVKRYGGNLSAASRALEIPRSTLRDRLRRGR